MFKVLFSETPTRFFASLRGHRAVKGSYGMEINVAVCFCLVKSISRQAGQYAFSVSRCVLIGVAMVPELLAVACYLARCVVYSSQCSNDNVQRQQYGFSVFQI